jgi:hypothetical protein
MLKISPRVIPALQDHKVILDQQDLQVLQDQVVPTEHQAQQGRVVIQAHKDLLDLLAHKVHLAQKVTKEILALKVFQ